PLPRVYGLIPTSLGMGLLVEKIGDGRGGLAPTLEDLVKSQGFTEPLRVALAEAIDALTAAHVVLWDAAPDNFAPGENRAGHRGVFMLAGDGGRQWIRRYRLSRRLNAINNRKKHQELVEWLEAIAAGLK